MSIPLLTRVALAISAKNNGRRGASSMIMPGTNAEALARAAIAEIAAAWEERWGDLHPGVQALRFALAEGDEPQDSSAPNERPEGT